MKVTRYEDLVWVARGESLTPSVDSLSWVSRDVVAEVRRRTPTEWWERAADVMTAGDQILPIWDGASGFLRYFGDNGELDSLPPDVVTEIGIEMFEAAREAGIAVLVNFARQLVPVLQALER